MTRIHLALAATLALAACSSSPPPTAAPPPPDLAPVELCAHGPSPAVEAAMALDKSLTAACTKAGADVAAGRAIDLSGAPPLLADPKVRAHLDQAAALVYACRAVATDDDAPCARLATDEARADCKLQRAFFHAARTPADATWRFPDAWLAQCRAVGAGAACEAYRDALRARDGARCPASPPALGDCRALATGDAARCPPSSAGCAARVKRYQLLDAGGLARLASDGDPADRPFAAAALGSAGACDSAATSWVNVCRSAVHPEARSDGK